MPCWLRRTIGFTLYLAPLAVLLTAWQLATQGAPERQFIFSSPLQVGQTFYDLLLSGELLRHSAVTSFETFVGFVIGTSTGAVIGLSLWYYPSAARIARPYVVAIGAVPVFALAPVIIVWFGIGVFSKVMMAALSTVVVAVVQAYEGTMSVEKRFLRLMDVMGASRAQTFRKVIVPSALVWVVNSMKLNIGLALLGAFIGEFISAERGLGYLIVRASGLFDMATVFSAIIMLTVIALVLTRGVEWLERRVLGWRNNNGAG
ncbi:MAG TPA: ABC transporter permease [Gammaproteobacteria bacterium]|nr:ABC transporter permease [Gammaproteobacteria bacterium]